MCRCCCPPSCRVSSRRGFLKTCAAGAALAGTGPLLRAADAPAQAGSKAKVAVVFFSNSHGREIWPYPDYDCSKRHAEVLQALGAIEGVQWTPVVVAAPKDLAKAIALKDQVDGYLVYCVTLSWGLTQSAAELAKVNKPLLVADEFLGGCGNFLVGTAGMHRRQVPFAAVSSTRLDDLVAAARPFANVRQMTPQSFAQASREAYLKTFARPGELKCAEDRVTLTEISKCLDQLRSSKFLILNTHKSGVVHDYLGIKGVTVSFDEFKTFYDKVDPAQAAQAAKAWTDRAEKVFDCSADAINKAGAVYLAIRELMKKYGTNNVTANCLGGFAAGRLPGYPCLGFMQILNEGGQGVCEAMPDDSVSMLMARALTGRPGYVSDPALDTSKNHICYAHCMAHTTAFGPAGATNRYRVRTLHNLDPRGACPQSFLPEGYMTTSFRTSVRAKTLILHQAKAVGNLDAPRGCRTQLVGEVKGDIEKLFHQWDQFGWHRVTVYGDVKEPLIELAKAMGLKVIEEA